MSPARAPKRLGLAKAGRDGAVIGGTTAPPGWGVMLRRAMVKYEASPGGGGESWTAGAGVPLVVEEARAVREHMLWAWATGVGSLDEEDMEILINRRSTCLS